DEMRDVMNVGVGAGRDRGEADGRQRGEGGDADAVAAVVGEEPERRRAVAVHGSLERGRSEAVDHDQAQFPHRGHSVARERPKPTATPTAAPRTIVASAPARVPPSQPAAISAAPAPIPAATPIRYHSHTRRSVDRASRAGLDGSFAGNSMSVSGVKKPLLLFF